MQPDTTPSADRERDYDGGYMAAGKTAENIVLTWLQQHPEIISVGDLRELRIMQEADCDCTISTRDGRITLAEIKSDKWLDVKGNFLFESLRINHTAPPEKSMTLGWSARSPAQWLLYYSPAKHKIHRISFSDFRQALQIYTKEHRAKSFIHYVPTDAIKSTINILIPEKYIFAQKSYTNYDLTTKGEAHD